MKLIEVNKRNLKLLLNNLRLEDKAELKNAYQKNYKNKFIKITLEANEKYFVADDNFFPLAIGGVEQIKNHDYKIGQVWLISSNKFNKNNIKLISFIKDKIETFKENYQILFNTIYKSNYASLKWLKKCGFRVLELEDNKDYKLFYFTKGGIDFDLRYITG